MYKRNAQGWSKHFDFMIIDELSLQVAFIISVLIRSQKWAYSLQLYRKLGILLILIDALVIVLHNSLHDVMQRGYYVEFLRESGIIGTTMRKVGIVVVSQKSKTGLSSILISKGKRVRILGENQS